ncbi:beta-glucosidase [Catalinimonas alkaloidigena]|uniref:beta-N-acetylhexosaminidase n=2 Tax=Catalinimonas alkaloidigena TaxID=1075417 RepID=A0A1G9DWV8_9BACT|nr:beta-glucosidase [Catalinimonas alkaloidigena]
MIAARSDRDEQYTLALETQIREYNVGGVVFLQGNPLQQAVLTNNLQAHVPVPLLVGLDATRGLGSSLDSTTLFPQPLTLGALASAETVYDLGAEIARQSRRLGVHLAFSPILDVNGNRREPGIDGRSFGEDPENVVQKGRALMEGLQHNGVLAVARHFPGYGDADRNSPQGLVQLTHHQGQIEQIDLPPFQALIQDSLAGVMVSHLQVPAYDNRENLPASLSEKIVSNLLQRSLKFEGLIFTDALNARNLQQLYKPGEIEVMALQAGNDVLLFPEDLSVAVDAIEKALKRKKLSQEELDRRVRKILTAKYEAGLDQYRPVEVAHLKEDLYSPKIDILQNRIFKQALTVVRNEDNVLPFMVLDTVSFASVAVNASATDPSAGNQFQQMLGNYAPFRHFQVNDAARNYGNVLEALAPFGTVIVSIHNPTGESAATPRAAKALLSKDAQAFLKKLHKSAVRVVVVVFDSPYSLAQVEDFEQVVCAYEDNPVAQHVAPQLLFGAIEGSGKLPVTVSPRLSNGVGFLTAKAGRLQYSFPEEVGMRSDILRRIDTLVDESIADRATPGCQVMVVKEGQVVWQRAYGRLRYDDPTPTTNQTLYDIASVTKVSATLQAVMFLAEQGLIEVNRKASDYLPELKESNKKDMVIADILAHQAGLVPFIPFYKRTLDSPSESAKFYSRTPDAAHPLEVVPGLYAISSMEDSLWAWTIESGLLPKNRRTKKYDYKYSDLGFYIMKRIVEKVSGMKLDEFVNSYFYRPMGLPTLTYKPKEKFEESRIAPTERDTYFRKTQIRGNVHDQGAAMLGGVAGHAGLFGTANDLAILMQMNLQNGEYGGIRYLQPETLPGFSRRYFKENRRGLGWDKPTLEPNGPTSLYASADTYGHSGFTGTCVWVDPYYDLVYVFLSNRVYPDASNVKLIRSGLRTSIQDTIYESFLQDKINEFKHTSHMSR